MGDSSLKEYRIKDFSECLKDVKLIHYGNEGFAYHYFEIYMMLRLVSPNTEEDAKELFRSIINIWISTQIQRSPETNRKRQRNLLINHFTQPDWKWTSQLEKIAKQYQSLPGRPKHYAAITFLGSNYFFDCPSDFRPHF